MTTPASEPAVTVPDAPGGGLTSRLALPGILALGLALRLLALQQAADLIRLPGDEGYYVETARTIAAEGRHPGSFRGPGYPFFVALVFRMAGTDNLQAVRVAHILLALLSIALVYHLARATYGRRAALWSALAMALAPALIDFTLFLWAETLFILQLLVAFWLLHRFHEHGRRRDVALAGLTLALAALTREAALPFAAVVLAWIVLRPAPLGERVRRGLIFAACAVLPIVPWTVRNYRSNAALVPISTCRWYPVAEGNEDFDGIRDGLREIQARGLTETQAEAYWRHRALTNIAKQQPFWIVRKVLRNVPLLLTPRTQLVRFIENRWYPQYAPPKRRLLLAIEVAGHALAVVLAALALVIVRPDRLKSLVLLYVGYTFALHIVANADPRFLIPLLPLACLYVGPLLAGGSALRTSRARRIGAAGLAAAVLAVVALGLASVRAAWNLPPNVLLISVDSLRADHLGSYGYARRTSPHLDHLAGAGTLFEQAISPTAWTLPGHASMLSGALPRRHGAVRGDSRIAAGIPWLPERLRERGYLTQAVVNAPFLQEEFGFARGFDSYIYVPKAEWRRHQATAMEALASEGFNRPFFLFVHYMGVHTPYRPPRHFNVFARPYAGRLTGSQEEVHDFVEGKFQIDERDRDFLVDLYDGAILAVDARIRDLLAELRRKRIDENTLVIVTADHGEEFLDHGSLWHSKTLFEELIHVPLIARGPGVPARRRSACLVTLMDIVPTVLALTGAPPSDPSDGRDLTGIWAAGACPARDVELYTSYPEGRRAKHGMRTAADKLVVDLDAAKSAYFDLAADPKERADRYPHPAAKRLEQALAALPPLVQATPRRPGLDAATREQLAAIGYYVSQ